jgi:HSP20 family protein
VARIYLDRRRDEEVERFFNWLEGTPPSAGDASGPEYRPPLDVIESSESLEIVADLPGVRRETIRVVFTQNAVLLLGHKAATACHREAAFHLAERTFGRFACLVRLAVAVDAGRARATLGAGVLHISLPRIEDRRGRDIEIKVESI